MTRVLLIILLFASPQLFAALGDSVAVTANSDKKFTVKESTYEGGSQKEYISAEGVVFAVTWRGTAHVDPKKILGKYKSQLNDAQKSHEKHHGRHFKKGATKLEQSDFIYETSGHMGDVRGRVYVPSLIPPSVSVSDIQ